MQRTLLLKRARQQNTDKKQALLEKLAKLNERVYQAMILKEHFISIYTDPKTSIRTLKEWIIAAITSKIPPLLSWVTSSSERDITF